MDYVNSASATLSSAWSTTTNTASDYWSKRPTWLGGPPPQQGILGGRRKTHRRRNHKVKRRRTGKKTIGFPVLPFRM